MAASKSNRRMRQNMRVPPERERKTRSYPTMRAGPFYSRIFRLRYNSPPIPRTGDFPMGRFFYKPVLIPLLVIGAANLFWFVTSAFIEAAQATDDGPIVYKGARIHTASGPVIERGVMIVLKGKILD